MPIGIILCLWHNTRRILYEKKIVVSSCAANLYPEMEHVREIRKGALVEMVSVIEAEYENECPRNVKEILWMAERKREMQRQDKEVNEKLGSTALTCV